MKLGGGGGSSWTGSGGSGGSYGSSGAGGSGSPRSRPTLAPYVAPAGVSAPATAKSAPQLDQIQTQIQFNETLEQVKEVVRRVLQDNKQSSEWYINDHGYEHGKRVERNIELLSEVLDAVGLVDFYLGHPLTPEELFVLKVAAYVHDMGRAVGIDVNHAQFAARYMSEVNLPFTNRQRQLIIQLCLLHANGTTKDRFGSEDLNELVRKRIITREEAFLASIIRIADALDVGKARVDHNTQGTPRQEIIQRIKSEMPRNLAAARLAHWEGHLAIDRIYFSFENNRLNLEIKLEEDMLTSYGENAAHRIKDTLRDIRSGLIDKDKITIRMNAGDINTLNTWYETYGDIFYDEIADIDTVLGEER